MPQFLSNLVNALIKHYSILLVLICLPLIASPVFANDGSSGMSRKDGFNKSKKVAVLVGVENYNTQISGFSSLNYAVDDVNLLSNTFKRQKYSVYSLTDTQATKKKIIDTINKAAKTLKNGDGTLVFSFSGHGLAQSNQNYLATYDSRLSTLENSAISVREITDVIRKTGVKRAVLFVDACRNDPFRGARAAGNTLFKTWLGGEGIQVLYGTGNKKLSIEDPTLQKGVFTHFVNKGLNGEAKRADGTVDFDSLARYVEREVPRYTESNHGRMQQPWRGGEEYFGDFIMAVDNQPKKDGRWVKSNAEANATVSPGNVTTLALNTPILGSAWVAPAAPNTDNKAEIAWRNDKAKKAQQKIQQANKAKREREATQRAVVIKQRNVKISRDRKRINDDHSFKKNALQIECRGKSNHLKNRFQKRMLDYDRILRHQLNTISPAVNAQQRQQAESRFKNNTLQQKRILNGDNKQRQLIITRECADKARLLERKFKLRIQEFERTLSKR